MGSENRSGRTNSKTPDPREPEAHVLDRVQELTWALLDQQISDDELSLLDTLLLTGDSARNRYLECIQLHTDLLGHFDQKSPAANMGGADSPVLSFLGPSPAGLEFPSTRSVD